MIRKASLTHASELLVDPSYHEHRQWVRRGSEAFWLWIAEERIDDLRGAGMTETIRAWSYAQADKFLSTPAGREFLEQVEAEARS